MHDPGGETVTGLDGQAMTQPVPAAVQSAAEAWLAHQRDPDFEPAPGWRPGDRTMLG
ncbi:MAG: hypothetical protein ACRDZ7_00580 [Acidimicrobiia bacterium]